MMDFSPPPIVVVVGAILLVLLVVARNYQVRQRRETRKLSSVPLANFAGRQLRWTEIALATREFELQAGEELLATLSFATGLSVATGESAGRSWTFDSDYLGNTSIYSVDTNVQVGWFTSGERGTGVLGLAGGPNFHLVRDASPTTSVFAIEFRDSSGSSLIQQDRATVVIQPGAANLGALPLLVMLAWYLPIARRPDRSSGD